MLQPFLGSVVTQSELSLIVIGGHCTHAVRKIAKPGDFRVQDDHGGTVQPHTPSVDEIAFAEHAVAACPQSPLYARVDAVRDDSGGAFADGAGTRGAGVVLPFLSACCCTGGGHRGKAVLQVTDMSW